MTIFFHEPVVPLRMANDRSWLISALCITLSTSLFCDFSAVDTFGCSLIHNRSIITPHSTPIGPPKYFNRSVLSTQSGWPSIPPKAKFFYPLGRFSLILVCQGNPRVGFLWSSSLIFNLYTYTELTHHESSLAFFLLYPFKSDPLCSQVRSEREALVEHWWVSRGSGHLVYNLLGLFSPGHASSWLYLFYLVRDSWWVYHIIWVGVVEITKSNFWLAVRARLSIGCCIFRHSIFTNAP